MFTNLFEWNEEMKQFLESEEVNDNLELWEQLEHFTELIENTSQSLSDHDMLNLQTKAEEIHGQMENYFSR